MKKFMKGNKNKEERGVADAAGGVEDGDVVCFRGLELKVNIKSPQTQQSVDKIMHSGRPEQIIYMMMIK